MIAKLAVCAALLVAGCVLLLWLERRTRPVEPEPVWRTWRRIVHNVVAHPLLELCPPLGERLHDRTAPPDEPPEPLLLQPLLDTLLRQSGLDAPYVLVVPAHVAAHVSSSEALAMVQALEATDDDEVALDAFQDMIDNWQPGMFQSTKPLDDDGRGVLIIPQEIVQ